MKKSNGILIRKVPKKQTFYCRQCKILSLCFAVLFLFILFSLAFGKIKSSKIYSIYSKNSLRNSPNVSLTLSSSKKWKVEGKQNCSALYECVIKNNSHFPVKNWSVLLILPEESFISGEPWNGKFCMFNEKLFVSPGEYNLKLMPKSPNSFGFILNSSQLVENADYKIEFQMDFNPFYIDAFKILVIFTIFVLVAAISIKLYLFRVERFGLIQKQCFETIANIIDSFDENTCQHSKNVGFYAQEIAKRLNFSKKDIQNIFYCGLVHDIGKISVMKELLIKASSFTDEEMEKMKKHTTAGAKALETFTSIPQLKEAALYHHERFDGHGYPYGLKGEEIPLFARVISVADSFDVMASKRPYKDIISSEEIKKELLKCSGTQFDPAIVPVMIQMIEENVAPVVIAGLTQSHSETSESLHFATGS